MMADNSASADADRATAVEPVPVSWRFLSDGEISFDRNLLVYALGRFGDIYGPLPVEMFHPDCWEGNMLHGSHDVVAVSVCTADWFEVIPHDAQAIETRSAKPQDESAAPKGDAHD